MAPITKTSTTSTNTTRRIELSTDHMTANKLIAIIATITTIITVFITNFTSRSSMLQEPVPETVEAILSADLSAVGLSGREPVRSQGSSGGSHAE